MAVLHKAAAVIHTVAAVIHMAAAQAATVAVIRQAVITVAMTAPVTCDFLTTGASTSTLEVELALLPLSLSIHTLGIWAI